MNCMWLIDRSFIPDALPEEWYDEPETETEDEERSCLVREYNMKWTWLCGCDECPRKDWSPDRSNKE